MIRPSRIAVAALTLSATAFVGIALHEGYTDRAVIPIPGDVPTIGFGTTTNPDGSPVRMGDTTTPPRALERALADVAKFEGALRQCVTAPMHQHEYDVFVSFSYNVGARAFCSSTLVRKLNAGDYDGACHELMRWTWAAGRDCAVRSNGCYGLYLRRERERDQCLGRS